MGNFFGCIDEVMDMERINYDMTPVKSRRVPIIWVVGPPGSNRNIYVENLCNSFQYENIRISHLITNAADDSTGRGKRIKDSLTTPQKLISDPIIVDLIKEAMLLRAKNAKGFVINGFPRTSRQGLFFVNEIDNVDVIIYLYGKVDEMVRRAEAEFNSGSSEEIRKQICKYMKEVKEATHKFGPKVEKVYIEKPERECYNDIESAISARISDVKLTIKKQISVLQEAVH